MTFPGGSQGNCPPPTSETLLSPTDQGVMLSTSPRELSENKEDTPSLRLGVHRCFPSGLFLLTLNKSRPLMCHCLHQSQHNGNTCGMAHSQWPSLCYWLRCNGFSVLLKTDITILSWVSVHLLILPSIFSQEFLCAFTWAEVTYLYEHRPTYKIMWKVKWRKGRDSGISVKSQVK